MKKVGGNFTHLEAVFGGHYKTSIVKMDTYLKQEGMVEKKKPRGEKRSQHNEYLEFRNKISIILYAIMMSQVELYSF